MNKLSNEQLNLLNQWELDYCMERRRFYFWNSIMTQAERELCKNMVNEYDDWEKLGLNIIRDKWIRYKRNNL